MGEELVNSEEEKEDAKTNLLEPVAEQQDIDPELKQWKNYLLRGKLAEDKKKAKKLILYR